MPYKEIRRKECPKATLSIWEAKTLEKIGRRINVDLKCIHELLFTPDFQYLIAFSSWDGRHAVDNCKIEYREGGERHIGGHEVMEHGIAYDCREVELPLEKAETEMVIWELDPLNPQVLKQISHIPLPFALKRSHFSLTSNTFIRLCKDEKGDRIEFLNLPHCQPHGDLEPLGELPSIEEVYFTPDEYSLLIRDEENQIWLASLFGKNRLQQLPIQSDDIKTMYVTRSENHNTLLIYMTDESIFFYDFGKKSIICRDLLPSSLIRNFFTFTLRYRSRWYRI